MVLQPLEMAGPYGHRGLSIRERPARLAHRSRFKGDPRQWLRHRGVPIRERPARLAHRSRFKGDPRQWLAPSRAVHARAAGKARRSVAGPTATHGRWLRHRGVPMRERQARLAHRPRANGDPRPVAAPLRGPSCASWQARLAHRSRLNGDRRQWLRHRGLSMRELPARLAHRSRPNGDPRQWLRHRGLSMRELPLRLAHRPRPNGDPPQWLRHRRVSMRELPGQRLQVCSRRSSRPSLIYLDRSSGLSASGREFFEAAHDEGRPSGLVARAQAAPPSLWKTTMEEDEVLPMRVACVTQIAPVTGSRARREEPCDGPGRGRTGAAIRKP